MPKRYDPHILLKVFRNSNKFQSTYSLHLNKNSHKPFFSVRVDGGWGKWKEWEPCPVSCGGSFHSRNRLCDSPAPEYGGDNCTVDGSKATEIQRCNENSCPSK